MDDFMAPRQGALSEPLAVAPQPNHLIIPSLQLDTPVKEVFVVAEVFDAMLAINLRLRASMIETMPDMSKGK